MAEDYREMAWVLRAFGDRPPGDQYTRTYLCDRSGLSDQRLQRVISGMRSRGWIAEGSFPGETFRLVGRGPFNIGKNEAQLLALDVAAWVADSGKEHFEVRDIPEELRADAGLLELAVRELVNAGALARRHGGALVQESELVTQPDLRLFDFGRGAPLTSVQIQQHVGDIVGRDKNVNSGSGSIVTGNASTVGAEAAAKFHTFVEELRAEGEVPKAALDVLIGAAEPDVLKHEVVGIVAETAQQEPKMLGRLKGWVTSLPSHLAKAAIVEGIKLYLKASGVLPP